MDLKKFGKLNLEWIEVETNKLGAAPKLQDKFDEPWVPEDSVRPETQTLVVLIRRKGFVGGFENFTFNIAKVKVRWIKAWIKQRLIRIILRGGIKSLDPKGNTNGESFLTTNDWRWETKVRIGNRILKCDLESLFKYCGVTPS